MGGVPLGLDAAAVFAWLELSGRKKDAQILWPQLRLIAHGAVSYWQAMQDEIGMGDDG